MGLKDRVSRLLKRAQGQGLLVPQRDGSVKVFDRMEASKMLFLARHDMMLGRGLPDNEIVRAYQNATPEGRRAVAAAARELDGGTLDVKQLADGAETFEIEDLSEA